MFKAKELPEGMGTHQQAVLVALGEMSLNQEPMTVLGLIEHLSYEPAIDAEFADSLIQALETNDLVVSNKTISLTKNGWDLWNRLEKG
jgi:hypothetical protein